MKEQGWKCPRQVCAKTLVIIREIVCVYCISPRRGRMADVGLQVVLQVVAKEEAGKISLKSFECYLVSVNKCAVSVSGRIAD